MNANDGADGDDAARVDEMIGQSFLVAVVREWLVDILAVVVVAVVAVGMVGAACVHGRGG